MKTRENRWPAAAASRTLCKAWAPWEANSMADQGRAVQAQRVFHQDFQRHRFTEATQIPGIVLLDGNAVLDVLDVLPR
jgi:hypothetical protein